MNMSKLLIAQIAFVAILFVAVVAMGMEIFAGHMNPDVILPWAYVAAVGWCGGLTCAILRLNTLLKRKREEESK